MESKILHLGNLGLGFLICKMGVTVFINYIEEINDIAPVTRTHITWDTVSA